jgi:hypothetical protein
VDKKRSIFFTVDRDLFPSGFPVAIGHVFKFGPVDPRGGPIVCTVSEITKKDVVFKTDEYTVDEFIKGLAPTLKIPRQ